MTATSKHDTDIDTEVEVEESDVEESDIVEETDETNDTAETDDADDTNDTDGADDTDRPRRWRPRPAALALVVALLLVAAAGVFAWMKINELQARAAAPEQARQAAMRFAADLGTYDYRDPAGNFRLVAEQSTNNFSGQLQQITEAMTPLLQQTKATSKGSVAAAGVVSADEQKAVVVLFLDQTIENTNTEQPRVDRSRMQLTLLNDGGGWQLEHVEAR